MVKYKGKRRQIEELQEQLHHLEQALAALAEDESSKMHEVADMEDRLQKLHAELADQKVKSARAHKHCMKLAKEWRAASGVELDVQTPEEVDFDIKEAKDFNRMLMTKLSEVAEQHPEIEQKFGQMCADVGVAGGLFGRCLSLR